MRIEIKKIGLYRFIGASLILIGLFTSLFLDYFVLNNWILFFIIITINVMWLFLSIVLKLEIVFFKDNLTKILLLLGVSSIVLTIIALFFSVNPFIRILILTLPISTFLLTVCWHFSISIYKKEKVISILTGIGYVSLSIFFKIHILIIQFGIITSITPIFLVIVGFLMIILTELHMKRKGLLKYL